MKIMRRSVIIIVTILTIIFGPILFHEIAHVNNNNNILEASVIGKNGPPVAIIPIDCLTSNNKHLTVTCFITFKDMLVLDTIGLTRVVFLSTRQVHSDSLRSASALNQLGGNCQKFFKDNDEVDFVRYLIEVEPDENITTRIIR